MNDLSLENGITTIRENVAQLPATPGVYRMLSASGEVLYVGKAKALKKRVISYTHIDKLPNRLRRMVAETTSMEFVHTHTEVEALLLESNLIKKFKPRFNILLKDDKSFPYIIVTGDHDFPLIKKHRGARKQKGEYFGPFASAGAVSQTIQTLQKVFQIRNCSDSNFASRKRPCLQYHIKRCTAPCVDHVTKAEYAEQIAQARRLLSGENNAIQNLFAQKMQQASDQEDFEKAAEYRDRIKTLSAIQAKQDINLEGLGDIDIIGLTQAEGKTGIQVFFFRGGQNFGNRAYYPRHSNEDTPDNIMANFLAQFYENKPIPKKILVNVKPTEKNLIQEALQHRRKQGRVEISVPQRGQLKRVMEFVETNAVDALKRHLAEKATEAKHLEAVAELFDMDASPSRIEVYDNSHLSGTNMVGGMIVSGPEGFQKNAYRKFNIREADKADDYGMMREVMERRFGKIVKEQMSPDDENWPDLLLIDGGKGQLSAVTETLEEIGVINDVTIVAIAKGEDRNAGREEFFMNGKSSFQLPHNDSTLHYLQRLRDEAHRFAIGAQRTRRKKDMVSSPLDGIPGIGSKRKRELIKHFGSISKIRKSTVDEIAVLPGLNRRLAEEIKKHLS